MTPTQIGIMIVVGVVVLGALAYVAQTIESNRRTRQLKLMELRFDIRGASHLLSSFPAPFMSTEIQQLLTRYLQSKWEKIVALEDTEENKKHLERIQERGKQLVTPFVHPEGSLTVFETSNDAARAQGLLKEFMKFLVTAEQKGDISKQLKLNYESKLKRANTRANCEIDIFEGLAIEAMSGSAAALPKLRNAFFNLDTLNQDHALDRQVYELRTYVDRLAAEKKEEEEAREAERKKVLEEEMRMNNLTF